VALVRRLLNTGVRQRAFDRSLPPAPMVMTLRDRSPSLLNQAPSLQSRRLTADRSSILPNAGTFTHTCVKIEG
jgi:hypothetical protein